jgi:cardiolipin synthase A/B
MSTIRLLKNGAAAFPTMSEAIDRATVSISLEMYIVADDETGRDFRERLVRAARRGVEVSVLIDSWGCWHLPDSFWDELRAAGGTVRWFHPITKGYFMFRNHRKLLLVDDRLAYLGGMNLASEYFHGARGKLPWRDNMLEISGTEVAGLRRSFARMWARADAPLRMLFRGIRPERSRKMVLSRGVHFLESGPENPIRPVRRAYRQVIRDAKWSIDLAMGYFYPHGRMIRALARAVRRGVRVRLMVPLRTDIPVARWAARGLYGRLLRAGVGIWEYVPSMMHSKLAISDDTLIAGSANLDIRSGRINYELVAVVTDAALAAQARADFEDDLKLAVPVLLEEWSNRSVVQKMKERFSYCLLARLDVFVARRGMEKGMW